ncbi:MAG: peptidoglycan-associated lipoprotein Pal [Xanthomonadales bacterium]|jgi:peptidoglycan-associated lipoprotein|nr:peptidoglycan-associated lipoprotein Pal [Xanthomonadales bacterium]
MQSPIRLTLAVVLLSVVTACKKEQIQPEETEPTTTSSRPAPTQEVDRGPDPRDYTDPRNLDNPKSLLSQRVVYFDFDQSDIRPEFRDVIAAHAAYLGSRSSARVTLEGHADERGSREYNLGLGERRGNSVSGAMSAQRASRSQLNVVSYGEERPVCRNSDDNCWQQNRRVEIVYTSR